MTATLHDSFKTADLRSAIAAFVGHISSCQTGIHAGKNAFVGIAIRVA
jgi:hypothetical protein